MFGVPSVVPATVNWREGMVGGLSGSGTGRIGSSSSSSSSSTLTHNNRPLHVDALEPGHPKAIHRASKQQILPLQSLSAQTSGLRLRAVETSAAIIDGLSQERACAKMCMWSTPRFSQVSETYGKPALVSLANCNILCMYMDALVASGRRMEAEEDWCVCRSLLQCFLITV
jgi:hypothetical protein